MPLYEYKCNECGDVFEVIQRFSDAPLSLHEGCGGPVIRLISTSALQFKGSGFYITDYAKGNGGPKNGSSKKETKSESGSDSSSSSGESKAEVKSESKPSASTSSSEKK
jgi:putative FmdB family regulatory protein